MSIYLHIFMQAGAAIATGYATIAYLSETWMLYKSEHEIPELTTRFFVAGFFCLGQAIATSSFTYQTLLVFDGVEMQSIVDPLYTLSRSVLIGAAFFYLFRSILFHAVFWIGSASSMLFVLNRIG